MANVKCKVCFSGTNGVFEIGDIMPVCEAEAKAMIAADFAELAEVEQKEVKKAPKKSKSKTKKGTKK